MDGALEICPIWLLLKTAIHPPFENSGILTNFFIRKRGFWTIVTIMIFLIVVTAGVEILEMYLGIVLKTFPKFN